MEVLQITTTVDESGHLHLDIPTELAPGQVKVVLVLSSIAAAVSEEPNPEKPNYDFSDLAGKLTWRGDAVAMQRALRDEW